MLLLLFECFKLILKLVPPLSLCAHFALKPELLLLERCANLPELKLVLFICLVPIGACELRNTRLEPLGMLGSLSSLKLRFFPACFGLLLSSLSALGFSFRFGLQALSFLPRHALTLGALLSVRCSRASALSTLVSLTGTSSFFAGFTLSSLSA
jgi:hypothetical protein